MRAFFIFHLPAEGVFLQSLERVGRGLAQWNIEFFPPDDTASALDPGDSTKPNFPQFGHGSIKLTVLSNDPSDPE
ncbi:MAG: hypothetical protein DMG81_18735 [Acidobacteria bacterium]|nr:MAG: hypothetical protein DMG81_18735 [Acidobacteriota bacterium]